MIIATFAGVGKTYFCDKVPSAKDFILLPYKYFLPNIPTTLIEHENSKADFSLERNPMFPNNYFEAILKNMNKYNYLVIPSDIRVLKKLASCDIPYILCYPEIDAKEKYKERYLQRGNSQDFLDIFIGQWEDFIISLQQDTHGIPIILTKDEYLLDAKERIDELIKLHVDNS